MSRQEELEKPSTEKHPLVILRPRARETGWEAVTANRFRIAWSKGPVTRVWAKEPDNTNWTAVSALPTSDREFWHDYANGYLYVYLAEPGGGGDGPEDPEDVDYAAEYGPTCAGLTVEYELYLSTQDFRGPRDPLDATSRHVEWQGCLARSPASLSGSRQSLYGFHPLEETTLEVEDQNGAFLPHLYSSSFMLARVRAFVMVGNDLERAADLGFVKEEFTGYCGQPKRDTEGRVLIPCLEFLSFLDRPANPSQRMDSTEFPAAEPSSVSPGKEWFIRRVRGMVDDFEPINIDYNATPATNVNRDFLTHEEEGTEGTWGATVDHTGTNTGTVTTLLTTPKCAPGDTIIIQRSGVEKYAIVSTVDFGAKQIVHSNITGSASAADQVIRYYVGYVKVQDSAGRWWTLFAGQHYSRIDKAALGNNPDWLGFRCIDDWEAALGFPETFDPAKHKVVCRVWGTVSLAKYADAVTDVGAVSDYGGVAAEALSLLHFLLREAGVENAMIDQTSFEAAATNHVLGLAIPRARTDTTAQTWRELIRLVLVSMIWKLVFVQRNSAILVGLLETGPFAGAADHEADELDHWAFDFELDYSAIYHRVELSFGRKEFPREGDYELFKAPLPVPDDTLVVVAENHLARDLHQVTNVFEEEVLHYAQVQAQAIADRYAFALGDRRAYYSFSLGTAYLEKAALGASYDLTRKALPGYALDVDTDRTRQLSVIESTKAATGVNLVAEDQKGIEDNSGDW